MPPTMPLISIVDDDLSVRRALRRLVQSAGYTVETFASAREFLDSSPSGRTACLVLDIHLEGMSGFELQERMAADPAPIPVIFITAQDDAATRERARQTARSPRTCASSFDEQVLLAAIGRAIGARTDISATDIRRHRTHRAADGAEPAFFANGPRARRNRRSSVGFAGAIHFWGRFGGGRGGPLR